MTDRYRESGVDIQAGDDAVRRISRLVASTRVPGIMNDFGGFGGAFDLSAAGFGGPDTILVSGADGVGTKLKLAFLSQRHDTIGIDCVAMCVNDILTCGAKPLFFLDYLATGHLDPATAETIVSGIAEGCRQAGCALLGGETAEMPGFYPDGEYDLAGFVVGAVSRSARVDCQRILPGHEVWALPSAGLHSNGYSLVRRVLLDDADLELSSVLPELAEPLIDVLLRPTRIYVADVLRALSEGVLADGMVHVTGGGLTGNLPRILPTGLGVRLDGARLTSMVRPEFDLIQRLGDISQDEMYRVFNMGVGFLFVVKPQSGGLLAKTLGDGVVRIGHVVARADLPEGRTVVFE